jgi:hypothetical protein
MVSWVPQNGFVGIPGYFGRNPAIRQRAGIGLSRAAGSATTV